MAKYYVKPGSKERYVEIECDDVILPASHGFSSKDWAVFVEHADSSVSKTAYTREEWKRMIDKGELVIEQPMRSKGASS